ncbi:hypothetical protein C922_01362 [Plasmodium inui San Antonio 1]|uniref:Uncharacterized protein n=1 Tax=Plasmodium inui San Antonio 1 TaxID=1237626 RepID=W7A5E6_9APIC|nr:hypothetical protein C922_01362 [Plasmodium inui San Antonio 1]EUD68342.1 hypothetical protein C922_01362 [Plasmodium inui San Antonio 1]
MGTSVLSCSIVKVQHSSCGESFFFFSLFYFLFIFFHFYFFCFPHDQRKRTKENSKSSKKKEGRREQSGLGRIGNKELHYVVKLDSDEGHNNKNSINKDKYKDAKKRNNKRRSLSVLVPNYKKDIVNNIKLADKLYKLTANKSSDESEDDNRRKRKNSKRDKKNDWNKEKKSRHRRSVTCGSYHSDSEHSVDSAKNNKKVDININEVQTKYKNKNIKIIYDDGYSKRIVVRGDKRKVGRSDDEEEKYEGESDSDDESHDQSDDQSDYQSDDQSGDQSDNQSDEQSDNRCDDESEPDGERQCGSQGENHSNDYYRRTRKKKSSGRRKRKEERKPSKRKKKKCAKRHSTTLSDSYCEERRKKNIQKGRRKFSTLKFVGARKRKESSEPIDRNYRSDKNYYQRAEKDYYPNMYERENSENRNKDKDKSKNENGNQNQNQSRNTFQDVEVFNPYSERGRKTMTYQALSTRSDQVKNNFFLTIKDIIFKLHLNLQNMKEILKNKNDYITSLLDSSYRNITENVKRNAIKQDNFYRIIFHDLFNLLNEFIMVDDYTKKFFFSIETEVRQRCLENIKNEFYNFINRYLPSGERRSVYSPSRGTNELSPQDMYKRIMDMHESANKRKNLYSALAPYNNGGGPTESGNPGSGFTRSGLPGEYQAHPDVQSSLHLNSLQQMEGGMSELARIDSLANNLALKVKNASMFQNLGDQEDAVDYLKGVVKSEKEKNIKLELQYDELKQKYDLLKKKREEDVSKEVNMSKSTPDEEDNFFKKFYHSQSSFIKLEEKKLEDSSKRIVDESLRLTRMKEMNESRKREIEKDMHDIEVKRKEIEKDKDDIEIKKKEIELANEEISKQNKQLEHKQDILNQRKKELEKENSILDNTKREVDEENDLIMEKKRELDELNKLLPERQKRVEETDNTLRKKKKEVDDTNVLLNEKQTTMQRMCTLMEREPLNHMREEGDVLEKRNNQLNRGSTQMKADETEYGIQNGDPNQQYDSGDNPHKRENKETNALYMQNDNPSYTPSAGAITGKHGTLTLEKASTLIVEKETSQNDMNIEGDAKRSSVLSYLGNTKFSLKNASKMDSNMLPISGTPQNGKLVLNDKNVLLMKNGIVEREEALLGREEKLNEEKEQIVQQMNQLSILRDKIASETEALHIREEELKRKELHLLSMQQEGDGTQGGEEPNVPSRGTNSLFCNAEETNSLGENSKKHFEPEHYANDSNEGIANHQMGHMGIDQPESDDQRTTQSHDEVELNEWLQKGDSTHLEGTISSEGNNINNGTFNPCGTSPPAGDNLDAIKSNLNNCLDEIAKYKLLLKSRDAEICSLKTQLGRQQGEANWNGDATQEGNISGDNSKMGDSLCNTGNAGGGINGATGFSSLSGDSGNTARGPLKQPTGFSGPPPEHSKAIGHRKAALILHKKTMKSVISSELITLYKEISKIREEYNKSILKKNEFIGDLLHNFFNEMRNNYKLKENFYQKESSKYHALISDKECYINELKNALQEKKAKEVSYKKMVLKMNQINDAYKLKNKRSLSTVEMLKQDIKLLNQDVLKKKEMVSFVQWGLFAQKSLMHVHAAMYTHMHE